MRLLSRLGARVPRATPLLAMLALSPAGRTAFAQAPAAPGRAFDLSVPNIMRGPELYGREPQQVRWSPDGRWIYFSWLEPGAAWNAPLRPFRVRAAAGARPERITDAQADSAGPLVADGAFSRDRRLKAVSYRGDVYVVDIGRGTARRLTNTAAAEGAPAFDVEGRRVFFTRDGNAFAADLADGTVTQLTDLRTGVAPDTSRGAGQRGRLGDQQRELLGSVRDQLRRDSVDRAEREARDADRPKAVYVGEGERVTAVQVSPRGDAALVVSAAAARAERVAQVPNYVTASGYTEEIATRNKVGDVQSAVRVGLLRFSSSAMTWLPLAGAGAARLTPASGDSVPRPARDTGGRAEVQRTLEQQGLARRTEATRADSARADSVRGDSARATPPGSARPAAPLGLTPAGARGDSVRLPAGHVTVVGWNEAGDAALVYAVGREFKTRTLHRVDGTSGRLTPLDVLADSAWVNGPCATCAGWYDGGRRAWLVSEADGYAHLYSVDATAGATAGAGRGRRQLTSGPWEVLDVSLTPDQRNFFLHTSEGSPFERHAWRMPVAGGARERLTTAPGGHTAVLSPDGTRLADVASQANRPPELFVQPARGAATQLTTSPTAEWLAHPWLKPAIAMIPASDGVPVPARVYRPQDVGAQPNGAGVIFVHGAGYLHNVHNYWSTYAREYMFNHLLAARGYVVLDIDYRGSAGYGRDWRTAIYRWMGGRDLQDHVDGSRYLQREFGVSPERVGIYGGSYGGFITLMALFTEPKQFGAGAALRSVTDWAHYNNGYTGRILNFPQGDTLAYRRSSPIYFAEGLEDPLLMAHGMVDTNVHFQDIVRLTQRLVELGKERWELAVYPVEDHAFVRPDSWTDEYRRILELFDRNLGPERATTGGATGTGRPR